MIKTCLKSFKTVFLFHFRQHVFKQLYRAKIPKVQKDTSSQQCIFISARVKAVRKNVGEIDFLEGVPII